MARSADQVQAPINIFYSYAKEDEALSQELDKHLNLLERKHVISGWSYSDIKAGTAKLQESMEHLDNAQIILLLISADFIKSDSCYDEMTRSLKRRATGKAQVIAIILRAVHYDQNDPFAQLQILPQGGVPIVSNKWHNHDEAWREVVKEIRKVITSLSNAPSKKKRLPVWLESISRYPFLFAMLCIAAVIAAILCVWFFFHLGTHPIIPSNTISTQGAIIQTVTTKGTHPIIPSNTISAQGAIIQTVLVEDEPSGSEYLGNIGIITDLNAIDLPTASEQCIYSENATIHKPFIVILAVTTLDKTNKDRNTSWQIGDEELQGLCQWQKKYAPQFPIKIFVANIGTKETNVLNVTVPKVTEQIISFANTNENFAGVVGFSFSLSVQLAMKALNNAHIPVISLAASSSDFSTEWPYFYRVIPDNKTEGRDAADYALKVLNAKSAYVISDTYTLQDGKTYENPYSETLGKAFSGEFLASQPVNQIAYRVGQSPESFKSIASSIPPRSVNPIVIFCSCYADDLSNLRNALPQVLNANIIIMGGEALYELGAYENNYANIYFTAFAYPDTGTIESLCQGHCTDEQKRFSTMYCLSRGTPQANCDGKIYGVSRPGPHTIQMYDALNALVQAYENVSEGNRTREKLRDALSTLKFEGISGWIDFNNTQSPSDPKNKIVLVVCVNSNSHAHLVYRYGQFIDPTLVSSGTNANVDDCQDK